MLVAKNAACLPFQIDNPGLFLQLFIGHAVIVVRQRLARHLTIFDATFGSTYRATRTFPFIYKWELY